MTRREWLTTAALLPCINFQTSCAKPVSKDLFAQIGHMLMVHAPGQRATDSGILDYIKAGKVGGVLLFESNFAPSDSPKETLKTLTRALHHASPSPLFIAIDQEGGAVTRLKEEYGFPLAFSAESLGTHNDVDFTFTYAEKMAASLCEMGINLNLAPVVDVNVNPNNPVLGSRGRCFSKDPYIVAEQAAAFIRGHHHHGVLTTLKHFPGHGSSTGDSHEGLVDVTDTWSETELIPYKKLISAGLVDAIMTAHIFNRNLDDDYPASLSRKTITGLLRQELGYDGVVISDDLFMGAIQSNYSLEESVALAINAGVDILLFSSMQDNLVERVHAIIRQHIDSGRISPERIAEAVRRIECLQQRIH